MDTFKASDRLRMMNNYSGSAAVRPGPGTSTSGFVSWLTGDAATIIEESSPGSGVFWIQLDRDKSIQILVSTVWFEKLPGETKMAAVLNKKDCTCDTKTVLMVTGCVCGAWKRYVEPHKRLVV